MKKTKTMASGPITSRQINGVQVKTVADFILAPKPLQMVTAAKELEVSCSWKKSYDKPRQSTKKQRHHFANKGPCSQILVFPVVMYGCESWTMKAEHQTTDAF